MPWYVWALIIYGAIDVGYILAKYGEWIEITGPMIVTSFVLRCLYAWALIAALHH